MEKQVYHFKAIDTSMKYLLPLFALLFLWGCDQTATSGGGSTDSDGGTTDAPARNADFQAFLDEIPALELPYVYLTCRQGTENSKVYGDHKPTPYFKGYTYVRGWFPLEGQQVGIISFQGADCMLPVLTTFSGEGKELSSEVVCMGRCGPDPCFECTEYSIIREDYSIYLSDTAITTQCDDNFEPIPGTTAKTEVLFKEGNIEANGIIKLTPDQKKVLSEEEVQ